MRFFGGVNIPKPALSAPERLGLASLGARKSRAGCALAERGCCGMEAGERLGGGLADCHHQNPIKRHDLEENQGKEAAEEPLSLPARSGRSGSGPAVPGGG